MAVLVSRRSRWGDHLAGKGFLAFVLYGAAALTAGAALYYIVELPMLRLRDRHLSRRRDEVATATA